MMNETKAKIVKVLDKFEFGLTTKQVSKAVGISKITALKYLAVLAAEEKIVVRKVGTARLYYLKGRYENE